MFNALCFVLVMEKKSRSFITDLVILQTSIILIKNGKPDLCLNVQKLSNVLRFSTIWLARKKYYLFDINLLHQSVEFTAEQQSKIMFQVQQVLASDYNLSKFLTDPVKVKNVREIFTELYSLDLVKRCYIIRCSFIFMVYGNESFTFLGCVW